jgi:amidase/aspartyl-tRNA(Asn)/glutamyl-tRNA(Gln) amidotransferase subunit A
MQAKGTFSPAQSYQWHRELIAQHSARYDPRVLARIMRGASMSAADYVELLLHRKDWIARMGSALQAYDAVLSPTVPLLAPAIADLAPATGQDASKDAALDAEFFRVNGLLLRNPSPINMLDGCAISLPCQQPGEPPVGLMLWHGSLHDDALLSLALQVENCLQH